MAQSRPGSIDLGKQTIKVGCPACGFKKPLQLGKAQREKHFVCPSCGERVELSFDALEKTQKTIDKSLADFQRSLSKFGKKR